MTALDQILASGRVEPIGPGAPDALERLAREHGVRLSADDGRFLARCNGLTTEFDFDEVRTADLHMALADINTLYGVSNR